MDTETLKGRMSMPLDYKIEMTKARIREWYRHYNGQVYVSFSGGKDSTALLHLVRSLYPEVEAVFCDTGLEFPEIREFVRTIDNVTWLKPKKSFLQVIQEYGYPVISKETAQKIEEIRTTKSDYLRDLRMNGCKINKAGVVYRKQKSGKLAEKWKFLIDAPFKISSKCCNVMKKSPIKTYERKSGKKPFIGTMAWESALRKTTYLKNGCNSFDSKRPSSQPLSFWTEDDIWDYIHKFNIPYSKIYDMGYKRTGCVFCMFGCHLEKEPNRFQLLKQTHPQLHQYCMEKLGLKDVLEFLNIPHSEYYEKEKQLTIDFTQAKEEDYE